MKKIILSFIILVMSIGGIFASESNILVMYFSATGNTERVAEDIANYLNGDIFEIIPTRPYSRADLNYNNSSSRVVYEHENPEIRPEISKLPNLTNFDVIFVGYPLWWQAPPNIIFTLFEELDMSGKIIIPFSTSISTGSGENAEVLHHLQPNAEWKEGVRFQSRVNSRTVNAWIDEFFDEL